MYGIQSWPTAIKIENAEGAIKNAQSRETDNTGCTRRRNTKQNKKTHNMCVGHYYTQANTNNLHKTWAHLQTNGGKHELEHRFCADNVTDITTRNSERKDTY